LELGDEPVQKVQKAKPTPKKATAKPAKAKKPSKTPAKAKKPAKPATKAKKPAPKPKPAARKR
jgi:hypothetical protein